MKEKIAVTLILGLILISTTTIVTSRYSMKQVMPEIYIDPPLYRAEKLDETFNISVNIRNLEASLKVVGVQFRIQYNNTLLEALDAYEGPFMQQFNNTVDPPFTYFIKFIEDDPIYGPNVLIGILLLPNENGRWTNFPEGNGTLAIITFKTIYRPVEPSSPAICILNLNDTMLVDENLNEVSHTTMSGAYEVKELPLPEIRVEPQKYSAILLGELFNITVNIYDVDSDWRMVGVQFRIQYNNTLLEALDAYEGPFMQQFNNTVDPPFTYFIKFIEDDPIYGPNVLIGILLLPNENGRWTNFPEGNGTLAIITFKTIYQPPEGNLLQCSLRLNDTMLVGDSLNEIPHTFTSGEYEVQGLTFTYEPIYPSAGDVVTFSVTEPEIHVPITYNWDFGDGTIVNTTDPIVGHMFIWPKDYAVTLTCYIEGASASTSKTLTVEYSEPLPLNVEMDVGDIHFPGETAEFNILFTHYGERVNPQFIYALLYHDGILYANLTEFIQQVSTGYYTISYLIPVTAEAGTYTLLVDAEYYAVKGSGIKSFLISSTLSGWMVDINGTLATIETRVGQIQLNLSEVLTKFEIVNDTIVEIHTLVGEIKASIYDINATISGLVMQNGELLVEIKTSLGTITTDLGGINGKIEAINGGIAEIKTSLGTITANLEDIEGAIGTAQSVATKTLYVTSALSAIAIILAIVIIFLLRKK